ncbi:MAG TPA: IS200/IS605 family transposase [Roseiflexaceae bacterium]|nr:IS200/IS605 family transposase [Roseiflexaceae bacterium]
MASYTPLYVHCVWSTWDRLPLIVPTVEPQLYATLAAKCREVGCEPLAIGGVAEHVHVLAQFTPTVTIAQLIGAMKGASSHLVTHSIQPGTFFKWQGSYGAFTIGQRSVVPVRQYILDQKQRHASGRLLAELEL